MVLSGLGFDFGGGVAVYDAYDGHDGGEVVGEANQGNEVGDEVEREDEVAEGSDDDAFGFEWGGRADEDVVEQPREVEQFAAYLAAHAIHFVPEKPLVIVRLIAFDVVDGVHFMLSFVFVLQMQR